MSSSDDDDSPSMEAHESIHQTSDFQENVTNSKKKKRGDDFSLVFPMKTSDNEDSSSSSESEEETFFNPTKKTKLFESFAKPAKNNGYTPNSLTHKMMANMGYKEGHGLGKHAQGRLEPVQESKQRGRRGLGLVVKAFEPEELEWDFEKEIIEVKETVKWLDSPDEPFQEDLSHWCYKAPKIMTIEEEDRYCDSECLKAVIASKSVFDSLEPEEMRKARTRSNPFETIRGGMFLNRAAMKMANIDRITDFMFTNPTIDQKSLVEPDEPLLFADVCAGPGGFSEYVLWRKKGQCKGFGFTLKGDNDFRLSDFHAGTPETFEPHYGVGELAGDGNVFLKKNINAFHEFVMKQTKGKGIHFMMADGGFSVDGNENIQEILSKRLYLCQFLMAILIVRPGGHFVCKLFDIFTPFSISLIYLMFRCFSQISIHKPHTSRPANSERYLICKNKKPNTEHIANYMHYINDVLDKYGTISEEDVRYIVPLENFESDQEFISYIKESNDKIAELQVLNLKKIKAFSQDIKLIEKRQDKLRKECLDYWKVPDELRVVPKRIPPELKIQMFNFDSRSREIFTSKQENVISSNFESIPNNIKSFYDWHCVIIGSNNINKNSSNCTFFLSLGSGNVYKLDQDRKKWVKEEIRLEISADTLLYGELITELSGEGRSQMKMIVLHIIDACFLAGIDIRNKHITERHSMCCKFAKAHYKSTKPDLTTIKVKPLYDLEDLYDIQQRFNFRRMKSSTLARKLVYCPSKEEDKYFIPGGIIFLKGTKSPWMRALSRSTKMKYYHTPHQASFYDQDRPKEAIADFVDTFSSKLMWYFDFTQSDNEHFITDAIQQSFKNLAEKIKLV